MNRVGALLVAALLMVAGPALALPASAADSPGGDGIGLQAVVGDSTSEGGSGGGSGGSWAGHGNGSGSGIADESVPPGDDAAVAEPVAPVDASSVLDVSGLRTKYRASFDPAGGRLVVTFVLRNSSHRSIDASARFWATTVAGHHVGSSPTQTVNEIAPGESRTVSQEIDGVGQWTFVTTHMELSPVAPAGAPDLEPVVRDRTVLVVPWAILVLALLVAAGIVSARLSGDRGRTVTPQPVAVA